jgi:tetratricopeptide (TPR) repeat protein
MSDDKKYFGLPRRSKQRLVASKQPAFVTLSSKQDLDVGSRSCLAFRIPRTITTSSDMSSNDEFSQSHFSDGRLEKMGLLQFAPSGKVEHWMSPDTDMTKTTTISPDSSPEGGLIQQKSHRTTFDSPDSTFPLSTMTSKSHNDASPLINEQPKEVEQKPLRNPYDTLLSMPVPQDRSHRRRLQKERENSQNPKNADQEPSGYRGEEAKVESILRRSLPYSPVSPPSNEYESPLPRRGQVLDLEGEQVTGDVHKEHRQTRSPNGKLKSDSLLIMPTPKDPSLTRRFRIEREEKAIAIAKERDHQALPETNERSLRSITPQIRIPDDEKEITIHGDLKLSAGSTKMKHDPPGDITPLSRPGIQHKSQDLNEKNNEEVKAISSPIENYALPPNTNVKLTSYRNLNRENIPSISNETCHMNHAENGNENSSRKKAVHINPRIYNDLHNSGVTNTGEANFRRVGELIVDNPLKTERTTTANGSASNGTSYLQFSPDGVLQFPPSTSPKNTDSSLSLNQLQEKSIELGLIGANFSNHGKGNLEVSKKSDTLSKGILNSATGNQPMTAYPGRETKTTKSFDLEKQRTQITSIFNSADFDRKRTKAIDRSFSSSSNSFNGVDNSKVNGNTIQERQALSRIRGSLSYDSAQGSCSTDSSLDLQNMMGDLIMEAKDKPGKQSASPKLRSNLNVNELTLTAHSHVEQGEYDVALVIFGQLLTHYQSHYGNLHPLVASTYHNMGMVHSQRAATLRDGTLQQSHVRQNALECFQAAARVARDSLGKNHPNVAVSLVKIGFLLLEARLYEPALVTFEEALRIRKMHYTSEPNHPLIANLHNNLGEW